MSSTATFTVRASQLLPVIRQFQRLERTARKRESVMEGTILDHFLELSIPGVRLRIPAATTGRAKFSIRLWHFAGWVKAEADEDLHFTLEDSSLRLRGITIGVPTTFFDHDRILRGVQLPLNYTYKDLARLYLSGKYTTEELLFHHLDDEAVAALRRIREDVEKIVLLLKDYGFQRPEVERLIFEKLGEPQEKDRSDAQDPS